MSIENFLAGDNEKINQLLLFSAEVNKMTSIMRKTLVVDGSRPENDAEHSWQIALMCMIFKDFAPEGTDICRAVQMCIIHDLVEIDAGDTYAYDVEGNKIKAKREAEAADKLFSMLPEELGEELRKLWEEFDEMETPDAKYAAAMDRIQPFFHSTLTDGHTWKIGNPSFEMVDERISVAKEIIPEISSWYNKNIQRAFEKGWLKE